jgi:radical SAM superfamily enzyme YgiQ (UPF0313 family)
MKTLLVFPRFKYPSGDPPLGVAYLAASLRAQGLDADVFDATFVRDPLAALREKLSHTRYDLLGITALTSMLDAVRDIAALGKQVSPHTRIVAGGPHATVDPEGTLALDGVDAVALGEGEIILPELVRSGLCLEGQPGFWFRRDGEIVRNPSADCIADLDAVPFPAWDLLDMKQYLSLWYQLDAIRPGLKGTSVVASRGCPFNCAYCQPTLRTVFGTKVRRRSPGNIIAELRELKERYHIDGVMWLDDTFLVDRAWMRELCEGMIAAGLGLLWGANVRADVADRESLALMREAGLRVMHVGIESATQRILDEVYQKGITVEQVRRTVALGREIGLSVRGYFMIGAPGETEEEARATVRLANELPLDDVTFSITTPLPHTHLYENTKHLVDREFSSFDYYKTPVYKAGITIPPRKLDRIKKMGYLSFYLGRRRLWRTVKSVIGPSGVQRMLLKLKRF